MKTQRSRIWFVVGILLLLAVNVSAQEYGEAPMLKELVEEGLLPPVEERLPKNPYVAEAEEIGTYGGTIRVASLAAQGFGDDALLVDVMNSFVKPSPFAEELMLNFAEKIETSDDMTTFTFHLLEGVKWSDGHPFTADDILFWYEDVLLNEELTPVVGDMWRYGDEVVRIRAIDDYTVEMRFAGPQPFFLPRLVHGTGWALLYPKHYLSQFHPKYTPEDELEQKVREAGFDFWYQLFQNRRATWAQHPMSPELPTLTAYRLVSISSDRRVYERNPYFWKVDKEGNQLPYIDRISVEIVGDSEVMQGMIMSGQLDFVGLETDVRNYPLYRQSEESGGFRTLLWQSGQQSEVIYALNQTVSDPILRDIFQDVRFRKALSLGIDRQEISDVIYFGRAVPIQYTVHETSKYYEPEFASAFIEYDPDEANRLLDEMGLDRRDSEGFRLRSDGERVGFLLEYQIGETPKEPNVELVVQYWNELGLDVRTRQVSGELATQRASGNLMDASIWHGDAATDILFPMFNGKFIPREPSAADVAFVEWGRWFITGGQEGEEPPAEIKELRGWFEEMIREPDEARRIELGKNILRAHSENLWVIGTVGKAPVPIIVSERLRNVPEDGFWVWDTLWTTTRNPETFFFAD